MNSSIKTILESYRHPLATPLIGRRNRQSDYVVDIHRQGRVDRGSCPRGNLPSGGLVSQEIWTPSPKFGLPEPSPWGRYSEICPPLSKHSLLYLYLNCSSKMKILN